MNNFTHKLYILTEHDAKYRQLVTNLDLPDLTITDHRDNATILLAAPPMAAKALEQFPNLAWLQSIYAGVDALVSKPQLNNYILTNVKGIFGQQIAEYVLGYTIGYYRHFQRYQSQQQQRSWQPHLYQSLNQKRMVILGTGSIGVKLAHSAHALGIETIGVNRSGIPVKDAPFSRIYHVQELHKALSEADIIVNTLPNTPETYRLLNGDTLTAANQALLFNVGRGATLCEQGLLQALANGSIAHAYLDVFETEPLDSDHPYWSHLDITVTPHIAALSFPEQVVEIFADNYLRWRDGFSLNHRVDFDKGY
ncbi:D-2-hydroxyacid dehydrogenase [Vibrio sp.]|uniref:D-2-hydroxyacid dehydrogenase n=1 Tax=Vibrio sp. TaxID=678 RepID=UPI003D0C84F4